MSARSRRIRGKDGFDFKTAGWGVLTSMLLHGLLVGAMVVATMWSESDVEEEVDKKMEFEEVELLKLGEEKPPDELPRISNQAPESASEDTVNLDQKDEPEPEPEDKKEPDPTPAEKAPQDAEPTEEKPPEQSDAVDDAFDDFNSNRPANEVTPEGSEKGVKEGTVGDEALANMMNTYQARLIRQLIKAWHVPTTISEEQASKLAGKVVVKVQLDANGRITRFRFVDSSPNEQFNSSIKRVLRKFQANGGGKALPLPDKKPAREAVLQKGLDLKNWDPSQ